MPVWGKSPRRRWSFLSRSLVLLAAVALAGPLREASWASVILPSLSPYVALGSALALRAAGVVTLLAVPGLLLGLVVPKFLCRHVCPTGLLLEVLPPLRRPSAGRLLRTPPVGKWLALATLGAAGLGWPLFLWLDPFALFNGFLNGWRAPVTVATACAALGLPALLVFQLAYPGVWCARLCPLGAVQSLLAIPRRWRRQKPEPVEGRRAFLAACAGAAGAALAARARGVGHPPLRPPGAVDEARFAGVCVRCGNCTMACPSRVIRPDLGGHGVLNLLSPVLRFDAGYCREDCCRCGEVCPSGAIGRLALAQKNRRAIGLARIDLDTCLLANGRECTACIRACPFRAIAVESPDGGFTTVPMVAAVQCTGCGACEAVCPVRPVRSIRVFATGAQRLL